MPSTLASLVLLLAPLALAQDGGTTPDEDDDDGPAGIERRDRDRPWGADAEAALYGGWLSGDGLYPYDSPMALLEVGGGVEWERGIVEIDLPVDLAWRETFAAPLREVDADAELQIEIRPGEVLRIEPEVGLEGRWRPDWDDLYQPIPEDPDVGSPTDLEATDRYTWGAWHAQVELGVEPGDDHEIELRYRHRQIAYVKDPDFEPIQSPSADPTHLVPGDYVEHRGDLDWSWDGEPVWIELETTATHRDYGFRFARDEGTGLTHAVPGGEPANPLQTLQTLRPRAEVGLVLLEDRLRLAQRLGYEIQVDTFQGYYSYTAPEARSTVGVGDEDALHAEVSADLHLRTYGPHSYAAAEDWAPGEPGHKPLAYGDRRVDRRVDVGGEVRIPLGPAWAVLQADARSRRTNFPDYQPGVFPRHANYDIEWSYTNWRALAGLAWEL